VPFEYASVEEAGKRSGVRMEVHRCGRSTMDGTEGRRRGFVAEAQRLFECFNQVEAATGSIFMLLLLMGPRQGPGSSLTAVGGFGVVAVLIIAIVRWIRGRNESSPPTAEDR
jgi:hypothetical protein